MTLCAIYARVSTDEQALSAEAQERDARRFAEARGWVVAEVYCDVGASGAEWTARPQLTRMLADATRPGRGWSVVLLRDLDRLGRDAARTALALEGLHEAGVRVLECSTGSEVQQDPMAKVLLSTRAAFAEYERAMTSARTRGALADLARRGFVTGGRVYGYRNVRVSAGVLREVEPAEAAIVREMFERRAQGEGIGAIVQSLNARRVPPPRATSWSPSAVGAMLKNPTYKGGGEWGRLRKGYRKGSKVRTVTEPATRLPVEAPAIVEPELWEAAQRSSPARAQGGRPERARYLLSGLLRCAHCGGPVQVQRGRWGAVTTPLYQCAWSHQRGREVCPVRARREVARVDAAVLDWIAARVLDPAAVEEAATQAVDLLLAQAQGPDRSGEMRAELARVAGEARRLAEALARGGDLEVLLSTLRAREDRAKALRAELAAEAATQGAAGRGREELLAEARARAAELRAILSRDLEGAREVVAEVFGRGLRFAPGEGWRAPWYLSVAGVRSMSPGGFCVCPCYGDVLILA
jgi:DNA invertase Pin-like site-specific DNA recombinase